MGIPSLLWICSLLAAAAGIFITTSNGQPLVPALFIFGDSAVDVGNNNYIETIIKADFPPYGRDFLNHTPTGQFCNGKLASDFTAENLGFTTYPPAYLSKEASGTNLLTGVNFASGASGYYDKTSKLFMTRLIRWDIDECSNPATNPCDMICINTPGSFNCSCLPGYIPYRRYCIEAIDNNNKAQRVLIGTGMGLGPILLLLAVWWLYKKMQRRKRDKLKQKFFKWNGGLLLQQQLSSGDGNIEKTKLFTSKELEKATDHYNADMKLHKGGRKRQISKNCYSISKQTNRAVHRELEMDLETEQCAQSTKIE